MLKRKEKRNSYSFRIAAALFSLAFALFFWQEQSIAVFAQDTAKVAAESTKIREKASTDSTVLASVKKKDTPELTASITDYIVASNTTTVGSGGNKTTVGSGGNVTTIGGGNSSTTATDNGGETDSSPQEAAAGVSPSQVLTASVKEKVRVRKGAGTDFDVVSSAEPNTQVSVSGEAIDGEGKLWYQVSFTAGGETINGFIRADYLNVLETAAMEQPMEEEPMAEPVEETAPVNEDYQLKYMENEAGEWDWYLFDNIQGTSLRLTELLNAVAQIQENEQIEDKQLSTMKIIVIAMGGVLVLLVVAITILLFKLRDSYEDYEAYEEDEEEEDIEEEEDEEEEIPVRASKARFRRKGRSRSAFVKEEAEEEPARTKVQVSSRAGTRDKAEESKSWQSRDFLELDDDMEFEFLDL